MQIKHAKCVLTIDHGTDDIDQVKVRIAQMDIDACYDAMYTLNYETAQAHNLKSKFL